MKKIDFRTLALLVPVLVLLWGCGPKDPGSPSANQPPTCRVVVAPMMPDSSLIFQLDTTWVTPDSFYVDTTVVDTLVVEHHPDHFVSPSSMFHVQWFGFDPDGYVAGYWIRVDGDSVWTTKGDSAITFSSAEPDPNDPTRMLEVHTLAVRAEDNEGLRGNAAEVAFMSVNQPPHIDAFRASFAEGATVGTGIAFAIEWSDPNPSGVLFRLRVDTLLVSPWDTRGEFQFCDTSDATIVESVDQGSTQALDDSLLTPGPHTLRVELKDLGGAAGEPVERHIVVDTTFAPAMTSMTSTYGTADYYPDGSIFYRSETATNFTMAGSASAYYGKVQGYRYRYRSRDLPEAPEDTLWSEWSAWSGWGAPTFAMNDLPVGQYQFEAQCRDYTGKPGSAILYEASIVDARFEGQTILVIDETRDGNGGRGSPNDEQCDQFYAGILAGLTDWTVETLDYAAVGYVSPLQIYDQRIIIWHADDRSDLNLSRARNLEVLADYLKRGGRLILSGWDVLAAFTSEDEATFASGFAYNYLRIAGGRRNNDRAFIGITGTMEGFGVIRYDPTKIPATWTGLDKCWLVEPAWRSQEIGTWRGSDQNPAFEGKINCVANFSPVNPWKTIVLGFPLYFMRDDEARSFMESAIGAINR